MHDPHLHLCVGVTEGCVAVRSSFQVKVPEKPGVSGVQVQSHKILLINILQIVLEPAVRQLSVTVALIPPSVTSMKHMLNSIIVLY